MGPNRTVNLVRPGFFMFDGMSAKEAKLSWVNLELLSRTLGELGELGEQWGWPYHLLTSYIVPAVIFCSHHHDIIPTLGDAFGLRSWRQTRGREDADS